ncbi:MAG: glycosyltransferase family 2 protein [Paludibacteraceae bacterium]|nr:glycosyltransferase family 2 protein [Paludibacteraceae bacterium]
MAKNYKKNIEMTNPKISVIMPVYNIEAYVGDAIDSIINQTFTDWELIVVNDGSKDRTAEVVQEYVDKRIIFIDNATNKKKPACLNQAISIARGDYFIIMDGDDVSCLDRLQKKYDYMESHPEVVACGCQLQRFGKSNQKVNWPTTYEDIYLGLLNSCVFNIPIVRMSTYKKYNLFFDENMLAEDYLMWIKLANLGEIVALPDVLYLYRTHDKQISITNLMNINEATRLEKNIMFKSLCQRLGIMCDENYELWTSNKQNESILVEKADRIMQLIERNKSNRVFTDKLNFVLSKIWYRQLFQSYTIKQAFKLLYEQKQLRYYAQLNVVNYIYLCFKLIKG